MLRSIVALDDTALFILYSNETGEKVGCLALSNCIYGA